jgi:hypothetical protein
MSETPPINHQSNPVNPPFEEIPNHPLAEIAGKFEGELWEATLEEIQRFRKLDRKRWQRISEIEQDAG